MSSGCGMSRNDHKSSRTNSIQELGPLDPVEQSEKSVSSFQSDCRMMNVLLSLAHGRQLTFQRPSREGL
jgi:hypothetical protein